jgi:cytochrome c peroxidase
MVKSGTSTWQRFVKSRSVLTVTGFWVLIAAFTTQNSSRQQYPAQRIKEIYVTGLNDLNKSVEKMKKASLAGKNVTELRQYYYSSRIIYKQISFLIETLNVYEARLVNGPALLRTEDDNPEVIVHPQGFQVIEEILFANKWTPQSRSDLNTQIKLLLKTISRLKNEQDLQYKFQDEILFSSFRSSIIRLASMGITGFDSPIAKYSLPEASATLDGILACLKEYKSVAESKDPASWTVLKTRIEAARKFINENKSFDTFDRLVFIDKYLDPVFTTIGIFRDKTGIRVTTGLLPVNPNSKSITDPDFFNIEFFSPNDRYRVTPERVALGKRLFFDQVLSGTGNRSCASCHKPALAFTDGVPVPLAVDQKTLLTRNTPTLWNSVFQTKQFFDSRTTTLENQLSAVVHNTQEMQGSLQQNIPQLKKDSSYSQQFRKAYKNEADPITQYNIANAIASYIRTLVALNSRFDQYMRGNEKSLNADERKGFNLFMGKAACGTCHYFPLFNGLVPPDFSETESEVLGVPLKKDKKTSVLDTDIGKFGFTRSEVQRHAFKTPTIRNIALTAPYMHNGVFNTLEEVLDFYNNGGGAGLGIAPPNQTLPAKKLNLTKKEITDIILFMRSLTDTVYNYRGMN